MNQSKRIIINTIAQYVRTILSMILSFISTRMILKYLGVDDYGIYSLVAGSVSLLSFLTTSLSVTTQRYLSVSQGKGVLDEIKNIYNTSLFLHLIVSLIVVIIFEFLYLFLFDGFLNIPDDRLLAAKLLYQLVVLIFCLSFVTTPFRSVIISHENIVYISIIEIFDSIFKLLIAYALLFVHGDKLIYYGVFLTLIQVFNLLCLSLFAYNYYPECKKPSFSYVKLRIIKELFSFMGWSMYNIGCIIGRTQGIAITINKFMGAAVNASYGLAFQVSGAMSFVSASLMNAINPQIMISEGSGNRKRSIKLAEYGCKFSYILITAISVPALFEMPSLLKLWLGNIPDYSVLFCRMVISACIVDSITSALGSLNQAIGKIRNYTLLIFSTKLITLPIVIFLFLLQADLFWIAFTYVSIELISSFIRIPFLHITAGLNIKSFITDVLLPNLIPTLIIFLVCIIITTFINCEYRFILTFLISISFFIVSVFLFCFSKDEKQIILSYLKK